MAWRGGGQIHFLDDTSLQSQTLQKELLSKEAKLIIASKRHFSSLLRHCKSHGLRENIISFFSIAQAYNAYLKAKYQNQKIIGIIGDCEGRPHYKYLGNIQEQLQKQGFVIVYFLYFENLDFDCMRNYHAKRNDEVVFANYEFLSQLDFCPFVISFNNLLHFHPSVFSLRIHSSLDEVPNYIWYYEIYKTRDASSAVTFSMYQNTYLNIHSKSHFTYLEKNQQLFCVDQNPSTRFVCGGYPSIDKEAQAFVETSTPRDTVIFVSALLSIQRPELCLKIISLLLEKYRVLFKANPSHISHKSYEDAIAKCFASHPNFIYQTASKPQLSTEDKSRSITAIECASSLMYSYPITSKRPSVLIYPKRDSIPQDLLSEDAFYHPSLHIKLFEDEIERMLLPTIQSLCTKQAKEQWRAKIQTYCQEDLYHFGCASEAITDFIVDWYEGYAMVR